MPRENNSDYLLMSFNLADLINTLYDLPFNMKDAITNVTKKYTYI